MYFYDVFIVSDVYYAFCFGEFVRIYENELILGPFWDLFVVIDYKLLKVPLVFLLLSLDSTILPRYVSLLFGRSPALI